MTHGLRLVLALAVAMMTASVAMAAPADKLTPASASIVTAATFAPPANYALQRELIGTPRADDRIVVAQRFRRGARRGGRGAGVAAGIALGILGAAALANSARSAPPPPGYYGRGPGRCERLDRQCYYGERWACRRLQRECY